VEDNQTGVESPHSASPWSLSGGIALSDCVQVEALADRLEAQFRAVAVHSVTIFIEMFDVLSGTSL
jgi:hypothetical protein